MLIIRLSGSEFPLLGFTMCNANGFNTNGVLVLRVRADDETRIMQFD
jgi:hypothetical protein